ncbi:hypothetical protein N9J52_04030 [Flavobacteriales bacterium]|nr:hypothetical protein [Flavobacteriales bacterium]
MRSIPKNIGAVNPLNPLASEGWKSASCHSPSAVIAYVSPLETVIPVG